MYIARLELNLRSAMVQSELKNIYELHRSLMRGFPDREEGGSGRVLFRVEEKLKRGLSMPVLMVSEKRIEPAKYRESYLLGCRVKEYSVKPIAGMTLRFCLRANPTMRREGKRVGLKEPLEQQAWLTRKADQAGFTLSSLTFEREEDVRGTGGIYFQSVLYRGVLTVEDAELFQKALYKGIGSGKGFGFGLLSVARG